MSAHSPTAFHQPGQSMLVVAKDMYRTQLVDAIGPSIVSIFNDIWAKAQTAKSGARLKTFQRMLREIPVWNSNVIKTYVDAILARTPYLPNLLAAVFLSYVKVLASVRLHEHRSNIRVKVPTNESFVHTVLIEAAREFYESVVDRKLVFQRNDKLYKQEVVDQAVDTAVRKLMPVSELLHAYIGAEMDTNRTVSPETDIAMGEQPPDISPTQDRSEHEHDAHSEHDEEPGELEDPGEPEQAEEVDQADEPEEQVEKQISIKQAGLPDEKDHKDAVLFSDAEDEDMA